MVRQRGWKRLKYGLIGLALALLFTACNLSRPPINGPTPNGPTPGASVPLEPLAEVAEIADPALPDWIEAISPTGDAKTLAQVRIRFKSPLIPLESLESPTQQTLLKQFEFAPKIPGKFRFLTPRMVGFESDRALPKATRFRVTLKSGLSDLAGHQLTQDLAWTFTTEPIKLTDLPGIQRGTDAQLDPSERQPKLSFNANTALDLASLQAHVRLTPEGQDRAIPVTVAQAEESTAIETDDEANFETASETFDPALKPWHYTITPKRSLDKATRYVLAFTPGLRPAQGNLRLTSKPELTRQIETYAPLAFEGLISASGQGGASGRFTTGLGELKFNNGLVAESALKAITVTPPPKEAPELLRTYDGDRAISLNPWALEPATDYTFTLGADLTDQFGQTLGQPVTVQYRTGDLSADLWAPSGLNIFPTQQDLQLNISTVNLPEGSYQAAFVPVQPTDLVYTEGAYRREDRVNLLPDVSQWQAIAVAGKQNEIIASAIPLREKLSGPTGMVAYGVQARTITVDGEPQKPSFYGLVQLTNLGVFAQWFPDSGLVQVHHLSDGSPVVAAAVELYRSELERPTKGTPKACATGKTDANGVLQLAAAVLKPCMAGGAKFAEAPQLLVIARENSQPNNPQSNNPQSNNRANSDWAFVQTQSYSGSYGYGIYADWEDNQPQSRGVIFSDRQLYQPGETAWFTGVAGYLKNGVLTQDKQVAYAVSIQDPEGNTIDLGKQTTNQFGTFAVDWAVGQPQTLGDYVIQAKSDAGVEIRGEFRVAEFKPPNFKVDLSLGKASQDKRSPSQSPSSKDASSKDTSSKDASSKDASSGPSIDTQTLVNLGETVTATTQSNYLFGPPVQDANVAYYVTRQPTDFAPNGWNKFSFGRHWNWPEEKPTRSSDVLQTSAKLDSRGSNNLSIAVEDDLPYPMTYRVDAEVADVSNLSVAGSQSFVALPSEKLIGLQGDFVADAGREFSVQVIVTDAQGEAIAGQMVNLELQKATYSRVTQVIEGSRIPVDQVEYETVATTELRSKPTAQTAKLTPPDSGSYRLRANFSQAKGEQTATDLHLWATGAAPVFWGDRYNNNRLTIQLDKDSYQVGETATALIQSPYPDADLYFSVLRHSLLYESRTRVTGGAPQIQFTVTPEMLPNAAVEAVLVRRGEPLETLKNLESREPGSLENLSSIGFAPFSTRLDSKYLQVTVQPEQAEVKPAGTETLSLSLKDNNNRPVAGQFTVMVVNEAVLQLSGYRPPDLVKTVYAEQPISTRFADNRQDVALSPLASPLEKGWGYGGGFSNGAASTRLREDFRALAYFSGSVLANPQGQAKVSFKLPDDLTTWRAMVVATDGKLNFGQGDATFVATQPLISNPLLPPFARQGDRLEAGITVTNRTNTNGKLQFTGQLSNGLQFANPSDSKTQTSKAPTGTAAYRFTMVAKQPGEAKVEFRSQLGAEGDAFRVPLTIKPLEITEQVVEAGTTTDSVTIPLQVASDVAQDTGGLEISIASNLLNDLKLPAQESLEADDWPCLESLASRVAIATQLKVLSRRYSQSLTQINLNSEISQTLKQLQALQQGDGGFAAWPGLTRSDPFVTPYVASVLAQAQAAGIPINADLLSRSKTYLNQLLADPGQYDFCQEASCKDLVRLETLSALADLGDVRNQYVPWLYGRRDSFDLTEQLKLARHLTRLQDWQSEANTFATQLQETIYETGRTATVSAPQQWSWLSSPTVAQAEALQLFVARKAKPERLSRLVAGLLAQRQAGTWGSRYNNAQALTALVAYAQRLPAPAEFYVTVQLAGKTIATRSFSGDKAASASLSIPMADLPRGSSQLQLDKSGKNQSGNGELHYLSAYRYRPKDNPPGRLNGLRITRKLYPANQSEVLYQLGLQPEKAPIKLPVGQVFDIALEVIADHPVDHVMITDPLPAGLEAVDTSFQTSTQALEAQPDSWQIDYQRIYRDRILAYATHLDPGVYNLHYLVRSVTPGKFLWPGATAELQYAPEEFGRTTAVSLELSEVKGKV